MRPANLILTAALIAGSTYVGSWFLDLPSAASTAWKGTGVALLALYALLAAPGRDGKALALLLAFGALGDVLLETNGLVPGALAFLAGHITAIWLYLRHRRSDLRTPDWAVAAALVILVPVIAYLLPPQRAGAGAIALYAVGLAAMAATAWLSRFPRSLTAAGALMFVVSDLLIFLRTGRRALDIFPMGLAVWGLYFAGQTLIALGGVRALRAAPEPA